MVRRRGWERLLAVMFPERCCCCGRPVVCGSVVCNACRPRLVRILSPICSICGCEIRDCRCGKRRRHTNRCIAPFYYEGAARSALHRLKFSGKKYVAEMFCLAMAQAVRREYPDVEFDCIVPIPLSQSVQHRRRFNQSRLLAEGMANILDVPCCNLLIKLCETTPQRELPAYRRSGNVLGVFDLSPTALVKAGLHNEFTVLLVDDTITTGSTMDECAKILKLYGARAVFAVTATASRLSET